MIAAALLSSKLLEYSYLTIQQIAQLVFVWILQDGCFRDDLYCTRNVKVLGFAQMDLSECTLPKCGTQIENFEKVSLILPLELTNMFCYLTHFLFSFREG